MKYFLAYFLIGLAVVEAVAQEPKCPSDTVEIARDKQAKVLDCVVIKELNLDQISRLSHAVLAKLSANDKLAIETRRAVLIAAQEPAARKPHPPVIYKEVDRMVAILTDSQAIFVVADSKVKANPKPKHYIEYFEQVTKNSNRIGEAAARHNVDPDLVRAIIWMESTHGYYEGATGLVLRPKTLLPMNVYTSYWTGFKVTHEGLQDPAINIDTGTKILARIQARTSGRSIAKIATLYGSLAAQKESEYGKTVEYYYNTKPWLNKNKKDIH